MAPFQRGISPAAPSEEQPTIGLIGMGEMGKMYAKRLSEAGWKKINACDLPSKFEQLKVEMKVYRLASDYPNVNILKDGHLVARSSDFIIYSVGAESIRRVVAEYGPSTKLGAVVAGLTSVKTLEREAFEANLPEDVHIVSCHSTHDPTVSSVGQPLVIIHHRGPEWAVHLVEDILRPLGSRYVYLSYEDHDVVTASTQAGTHTTLLESVEGSNPSSQPSNQRIRSPSSSSPPNLSPPNRFPRQPDSSFDNPLAIGRSDLDPIPTNPFAPLPLFGGIGDDGMVVGPNHPIFSNRSVPRRSNQSQGPWGGDGFLPPLGAPPGARFDPVTPMNQPPGRGGIHPRGGNFRSGGPDNDEFPPPGMNDMFF